MQTHPMISMHMQKHVEMYLKRSMPHISVGRLSYVARAWPVNWSQRMVLNMLLAMFFVKKNIAHYNELNSAKKLPTFDDKLEHILFLFIFRFWFSRTTEHKSREFRETTLKIRKCKQIISQLHKYYARHEYKALVCLCLSV